MLGAQVTAYRADGTTRALNFAWAWATPERRPAPTAPDKYRTRYFDGSWAYDGSQLYDGVTS